MPGYNSRTFPFLLLRNSKALNLVNLATLSMHRLMMRPNQTGSFEKMVVHVNNDQVEVIFVTKMNALMEARIESSFIESLREIIARSIQSSSHH